MTTGGGFLFSEDTNEDPMHWRAPKLDPGIAVQLKAVSWIQAFAGMFVGRQERQYDKIPTCFISLCASILSSSSDRIIPPG